MEQSLKTRNVNVSFISLTDEIGKHYITKEVFEDIKSELFNKKLKVKAGLYSLTFEDFYGFDSVNHIVKYTYTNKLGNIKSIEFEGLNSGDGDDFCWDVSFNMYKKLIGKEPKKCNVSIFNKGYYRVYPYMVCREGNFIHKFSIEIV